MSHWREITTENEWQTALVASSERPFLVLKHSTTCPVSANALREFEDYLQKYSSDQMDYLLVKVIESRPVSNLIAEDTNVKHASPQIIYIKDQEPIWNSSHWAITEEHIHAVLS